MKGRGEGREQMGAPGAAAAVTCKASLLMALSNLGMAAFIVLLQSLRASEGVSATIFVFYQDIVSSLVLLPLAFFLEKERPPLSFRIGCWVFLLGFLQLTLAQLLLTSSLGYITASFQTSLLNTTPAVVFVLAVASGRESFRFCRVSGQAKLWGTLVSAAGATGLVLSTGTTGGKAPFPSSGGGWLVGFLMVEMAVLASATSTVLLERVVMKYSADLTLSALITVTGAVQTGVLGVITERNSSAWRIRWRESHELLAILYGGIVMSGIFYYVSTWCIHRKGPVFAAAFSPLLIVFSFLLEMVFFGATAHYWSIVGAVLVVGGLYLLLWAKAKDYKTEATMKRSLETPESSGIEPLLPEA